MKKALLSFILVFFYSIVTASEVQLNIDEATDELEFQNEYVNCFVDSTGQLSVEEIQNKKFSKLEGGFVNLKIGSAYWLQFSLNATSTETKKWVFEVLDSHQELVEVYMYRKNSLVYHAKTGQLVNDKSRIYIHKNHVLDLPIQANDSLQFFIRFKSNLVGSMLFKIRTNANFSSYAFKEYYYLGLYYGILFLICLINIVLFILLKQRIYLFYLVYVLAWVLLSMIDDGIGKHLIWGNYNWVDHIGYYFAKPILISSYVWYSLNFFRGKQINRKYKRTIIASALFYIVLQICESVFNYSSPITTWVMFIPLIVILQVAFNSYNKGFSPARFFILGNVFILMGFLIRFLQDLSIIRFVSYDSLAAIMAVYSRNIGVVFEVVTLTLALGDRFRFVKQQNDKHQEVLMKEYAEKEILQEEVINHLKENEALKDKVNKELETKVKERTVELQLKSDELEELNIKLNEQAKAINEMNRLLDLDNYKLKNQVKEVSSNRALFKDVSFDEFKALYPDKLSVLRYLNDHKWQEGYVCRKCGNTKFCDGNTRYSRRCTKCRYDESITAFTIFHKCKFPLEQAFYIVSKTIRLGNDLNTQTVSEELELRKNTVWNYKSKVLATIEANKKSRNAENFITIVVLNPAD